MQNERGCLMTTKNNPFEPLNVRLAVALRSLDFLERNITGDLSHLKTNLSGPGLLERNIFGQAPVLSWTVDHIQKDWNKQGYSPTNKDYLHLLRLLNVVSPRIYPDELPWEGSVVDLVQQLLPE
jgi:hypothetical protein